MYIKLRTNVKKQGCLRAWLIRVGCVLIIIFGLTGSVFGLMNAIPGLIGAVRHNGNPFAHLFEFGCKAAAGGGNSSAPFNDTVCILTKNGTFNY